MLTSWIQSVSVLRNICAHNSRIYNRTIRTIPQILINDKTNSTPTYNGLYQVLLAMKYLRPSDDEWKLFYNGLEKLIDNNSNVIDLSKLNMPLDWKNYLKV